ncbi:11677_t:CDS:2, partial [Scutellospora calospora]
MTSFTKIFVTLIAIISFLSYFAVSLHIPVSETSESLDGKTLLRGFCEKLSEGKIECICSDIQKVLNEDTCDATVSASLTTILGIIRKSQCTKEGSELTCDEADQLKEVCATCDSVSQTSRLAKGTINGKKHDEVKFANGKIDEETAKKNGKKE